MCILPGFSAQKLKTEVLKSQFASVLQIHLDGLFTKIIRRQSRASDLVDLQIPVQGP